MIAGGVEWRKTFCPIGQRLIKTQRTAVPSSFKGGLFFGNLTLFSQRGGRSGALNSHPGGTQQPAPGYTHAETIKEIKASGKLENIPHPNN